MIHRFRMWSCRAARIRQARQIGLLFDCDGTVCSIAGPPELPPTFPHPPRKGLHALTRDSWVAVGVISGCGLRDLWRGNRSLK